MSMSDDEKRLLRQIEDQIAADASEDDLVEFGYKPGEVDALEVSMLAKLGIVKDPEPVRSDSDLDLELWLLLADASLATRAHGETAVAVFSANDDRIRVDVRWATDSWRLRIADSVGGPIRVHLRFASGRIAVVEGETTSGGAIMLYALGDASDLPTALRVERPSDD